MPSLTGVLETSLYVEDLDRASRFYEETLGLTRIEGDDRFRAYGVAGRSGLLLFKRGASNRVAGPPGCPRAARRIASPGCPRADWARTTAAARCIWHFPSLPKIYRHGKNCSSSGELRLRLVSNGRAAAGAFIFATRTIIRWNWPLRVSGRSTEQPSAPRLLARSRQKAVSSPLTVPA